jgi:hypothetical protein
MFTTVQHDGDIDPDCSATHHWSGSVYVCTKLPGTSSAGHSSDSDGRHENDQVHCSLRSSSLLGGVYIAWNQSDCSSLNVSS